MRKTLLIAVAAFAAGALLVAILIGSGLLPAGFASPGSTRAGGQDGDATEDGTDPARFHCPMHPTYVSEQPGDCPICDMRLVPIHEPEPSAGSVDEHASHAGAGGAVEPSSPRVPGYMTVSIPAHKQQSIGVTTAPAVRKTVGTTVRTVGRVDYDETGLTWVNARVAGWVEALHVNRTGQFVRRGAPILEIYSPELVSSQQELIVAREHLERLEASGARPDAIRRARGLVSDARRRLELWEIPAAQIDALEKSREITRRMTLDAPASGYVVEKTVLPGQAVSPGENLFRIADLSRVWVLAEAYESQIPLLRKGQSAEITVKAAPGRVFRGTVDYVYPTLNPATRTVAVRIVVPNAGLTLRPEMYAVVRIESPVDGEPLVVPNEAVLDTGERRIVFVAKGDGVFEPRELTTGLRTPSGTVVLEGLEEGEPVVTSGNFLIDSESRLKAALAGMAAGAGSHAHGS